MDPNRAAGQDIASISIREKFVRLLKRRSSGAFVAEIDGLRFLAIMPVVFMHLESNLAKAYPQTAPGDSAGTDWFLTILHSGGHGVLLFFVISGFIIARPFISAFRDKRSRFGYRSYLMRRFIRLEPAYFTCLILAYIGQCVFLGENPLDLLPNLLAAGIYMHSIIFGEWNVLNGVTWSLEVEFQFYILAPVFAIVFLIGRPTTRYIVTLALIALWVYVARFTYDWSLINLKWSLITYGSYFLTGFLLADLHSSDLFRRKSIGFDLLAITGLALIFSPFRPFYDTAFYLMLFIGVFYSKYIIHTLRSPSIYLVGGMCYTIYLYHYPLIYFIGLLLPPITLTNNYVFDVMINIILLSPIIVMMCGLLFIAIEKPFMNRQLGELAGIFWKHRGRGQRG